jgi:hypothetical protein
MSDDTEITVSLEEAQAFARRFGMAHLPFVELERLRDSMVAVAKAGNAVPRVPSKFDAPAFSFRVLDLHRG